VIQARLQALAGTSYPRWVAGALGALLVLAFAPFGWYWLAPFVLALLLLLIDLSDPREGAWTGFAFGFGLFAAGTWWLYISLNILGGLWPPLAVLLMLGLVVIMASYSALVGYTVSRWATRNGLIGAVVVFPAVWTVAEWLRGWLFTGFPWMSIGYSQVESLLGAFAPVGGVYGVTWLTVLLAGLSARILVAKGRSRIIAAVLLLTLVAICVALEGRTWTQNSGDKLAVRLVQGGIAQEKKWLPEERQRTLDLYRDLSRSEEALDLIVWPEAAVPALPFEVTEYLQSMHVDMLERDTQLLIGILTYDIERDEFLNTLWAIGEEEGQYHKRHLVPFGEYFPVPDFVRRIMRLMNLPSENVSAGVPIQRPLYAKGVAIAPTICYEIAYGSEQLSFFPEAGLMVNVSNDAWFGDTIAPHQHLQINQFRSRETGRYMLRATNTGITAVIDGRGNVVERISQFQPGVVDAMVQPQAGLTPYLRYGNWPVIGLALLAASAGIWFGRRATH
jgi:apolipoprotein N-acyltransferase